MPGVTTAYQSGVHGSRPAAGAGCILYACSTHSLIYRSDGTTWTTWMTIGTSTTSVATDPIFDAAGDIPVGTGADAAAKLAIGAAGGALSVINGAVAWNSGTAFPASKLTGDRYWRTDLGLECYWDGTRWLTTKEYVCHLSTLDAALPSTANETGRLFGATDLSQAGQWITRIDAVVNSQATNDGSNFWTWQLVSRTAAAVAHNVGASFTTAADTAATWVKHTVTVGALVTAGDTHFSRTVTKTSTPGNLYDIVDVFYRLVVT